MSPKIPKISKDPDDEGNVDPKWKYSKPKFVQPGWEYIKRADILSLVEVFEMFFGKRKVSNEDLEYLDWGDNPPQPDHDIYKLFVEAMIQGYFGDLGRGLTTLSSCSLPTKKVFTFIQDKDIVGLLKSQGYETQPGLRELIKYFSAKEVPEAETRKEESKNCLLPAPEGTVWGDVKITLIARDSVEVSISGGTERYSYHELEMSDKRSGDKPKAMWWFLVHLLKENGFISRVSENYNPNLPDTAKGFKSCMKNLFKIKCDVLGHYKIEKGYRAKFATGDRTQITLKELMCLPDAN
jgi:hypothetical protein